MDARELWESMTEQQQRSAYEKYQLLLKATLPLNIEGDLPLRLYKGGLEFYFDRKTREVFSSFVDDANIEEIAPRGDAGRIIPKTHLSALERLCWEELQPMFVLYRPD